MSQVNISYKTAKALKEFLGEAAPEPMERTYWQMVEAPVMRKGHPEFEMKPFLFSKKKGEIPAYQLHDLLSKPFCEAFIKERFARSLNHSSAAWEVIGYIEQVVNAYYNGGLPAVEKALCEMMEAK